MYLQDGRKASVLFIDDDLDVLGAFGHYLKTAGLEVVTFSDPWDGIRAAVELLPDVIILDVAMPGLDAYDVVDALQVRRDTRAIPVILFSGWPRERQRESPQIHAYIQKPCTPADLVALVRMFGGRA